MKAQRQVLLIVALAIAFGTAWKAGSRLHTVEPTTRTVKNLALAGDADHTVAVGRELLIELQAHNWNWSGIDDELLRVPDQYSWQHAPNGQGFWTWSQCPQAEYQDEVAFVSSLYVWRDFEVVPGIEGRLHVSGFYIVGWKDGRVEKVPVSDARLYPTSAGTKITVFPGMGEYDAELPREGDSDMKEKFARWEARKKTSQK